MKITIEFPQGDPNRRDAEELAAEIERRLGRRAATHRLRLGYNPPPRNNGDSVNPLYILLVSDDPQVWPARWSVTTYRDGTGSVDAWARIAIDSLDNPEAWQSDFVY